MCEKKKAKNLKITIAALVAMSQEFRGLLRVTKGEHRLTQVTTG